MASTTSTPLRASPTAWFTTSPSARSRTSASSAEPCPVRSHSPASSDGLEQIIRAPWNFKRDIEWLSCAVTLVIGTGGP
eukprot:4625425-Pyramimonas_sp.AAC.1